MRGGVAPGSVQSALQSAQEHNFSYELQLSQHIGSSTGRRRVVPGRSVLVSAVAEAVVRRSLRSSLLGGEEASRNAEAVAAGVSLSIGSSAAKKLDAGVVEDNDDAQKEPPMVEQLRFVVGLLSCSDVDVRDAAIKAFKKTFGTAATLPNAGAFFSSQGSSLLVVWGGVVKALLTENHPPNVRRLLRLLARVGFHLREGCSLPTPVEPLWDHLQGLCEEGSEDVHGGALEVLGVVIRLGGAKPGDDSEGCGWLAPCVDEYAGVLECAVDSAQPVVTRAAAVASLASSSLLKAAPNAGGAAAAATDAAAARSAAATPAAAIAAVAEAGAPTGPSDGVIKWREGELPANRAAAARVRLWFVALSLLQDDNESVRNCAARACAAAVASGSRSPIAGGTARAGDTVRVLRLEKR